MLWARADVRNTLALCHAHNRFLFEARPDLFPTGLLSHTEVDLWARFYEQRNQCRG